VGCSVTLSYSPFISEKKASELGKKIFSGYRGFNVDNFATVVSLATTTASFTDSNNFGIVFKKLASCQKYLPGKEFIKCIQSQDQQNESGNFLDQRWILKIGCNFGR